MAKKLPKKNKKKAKTTVHAKTSSQAKPVAQMKGQRKQSRFQVLAKYSFGTGKYGKYHKFVLVVLLFVLSITLVSQFSAQARGTFSNEDQIQVLFDHTPERSELDSLLNEKNINPRTKEVSNGNTLEMRVSGLSNEQRSEFFTEAAEKNGVVSAAVYQVIPVNPYQRYQVGLAIGAMIITAGVILYLGFKFRRNQEEGIKIFITFFTLNVLLALVTAAGGILLSKTGIIGYDKETFGLYVALVLTGTMVTIYFLQHKKLRPELFKLLFSQNS